MTATRGLAAILAADVAEYCARVSPPRCGSIALLEQPLRSGTPAGQVSPDQPENPTIRSW